MAINYVTKYAKQIDERFKIGSITESAVNHDFDFVGAKTVKVFSVPTVAMGDYQMSGSNRYGTPEELTNSVQEMTMTQDKAFTFTVDRRNADETGGALAAGKALARQQDEVITPAIDAYRLSSMARNAGHVEVGSYEGTGNAGPYERFLDAMAYLDDRKVPKAGRMIYVTSKFYKRLKLDDSFIKAKDIDTNKLTNGQVGAIDGVPVITAPLGYLPAGVSFLVCHSIATTAPQKIADYRVHDNPPGINGQLVEGRVYYDAFVLDNKRDALYVLRGELTELQLALVAGETAGNTKVTVTGNVDGCTLKYKTGASQAAPAVGTDLTSWADLPAGGEVAVTAGNYLVVAAADAEGKAVGAGRVKVTAAQIKS